MPGVDRNPLILALDVPSRKQAVELARRTSRFVSHYKVGSQLFTSEGPDLIRDLKSGEHGVFLDLKFHDIPNTVAKAAEAAAALGVDMFDVHASGGAEMMKAAVEAAGGAAQRAGTPRPLVLAITVLTSMSSTVEEVLALAERARNAGADGVVASAWEARAIRDRLGADFLIVTPGIRPSWAAANDQRRVASPREAIENGADFIVVGRPIQQAQDPGEAARLVCEEMATAEVRR